MFFAKKTVVCVFIIREEEEKEDGYRVFGGYRMIDVKALLAVWLNIGL